MDLKQRFKGNASKPCIDYQTKPVVQHGDCCETADFCASRYFGQPNKHDEISDFGVGGFGGQAAARPLRLFILT
jgi:hypothetical protein